jgi:hypothetical protein
MLPGLGVDEALNLSGDYNAINAVIHQPKKVNP